MTDYIEEIKKSPVKAVAICCVGIVFCMFVAAFVFGMTGNSSSSSTPTPALSISQIKGQAREIPFNDLMRNPENFKNTIVNFRGKVIQVQDISGDRYALRVATKETEYLGYSDDVIYVNYQGTRLLEDDIVNIWGTFTGLKRYTAVLGNEITLPEIDSLTVEILQAKK